jgi:parallel beta-helix repeat protein
VARQQILEIGATPVEGDTSSTIVSLRGASVIETQAGDAYVIENVREALTEPGEWYLDRNTGVLTYLADPGMDLNASEVVAPRLEQIVRIDGGAGTVSNLHFAGLTFSHAEWLFNAAAGYDTAIQAEADPTVKAAVSVEAAHDVAFTGCTFSHVGAYALDFGRAAKDNRVADSTLTDLGAGGVRIGTVTRAFSSDDGEIASGNTVTNNTIEHGGRVLPGGVGILVGHAHHNQIDHNDVDDFYYSGISVGWNWEFIATPAHDNVIEFNDVSRIGQGINSDLGGIYAPGVQPGTVIRSNRVHDVSAGRCGTGRYCYGAAGIYLDNAASNMVIERNLVYGINGDAIFDHSGEGNVVSNNVLDGNTSFMRSYDTSRNNLSGSILRNIMVCRGLCTYFDWEDARYTMDDNVYFRPAMPVLFGYRAAGADTYVDFSTWAGVGWRDSNALEADPLFMNLAGEDYRLQSASPALGSGRQGRPIGFEPLPIDQMGRQR